jgi:hypothetical protein
VYKTTTAIAGVALVLGLAACGNTHTVYVPSVAVPVSQAPSSPAASFSDPPDQSSSAGITTFNRLSSVTCSMVAGEEDSPTGDGPKVPTLTPAITVLNTSESPLNLIQYTGGAVMFDIWFLNSAGGVVGEDTQDPDLASPYDDASMALNPGQTTTFTAQQNPISGQVPDNENESGQGVTACKAMFVDYD